MGDEREHAWEGGVEATWTAIKESADGTLNLDGLLEAQRKRSRRFDSHTKHS